MRVLISGAGIAGPTLAYWLLHYGFEVTIVEKAPKLRTGGYIIDFWGAGFDIAESMGLMSEIRGKGYLVEDVRVVDRAGKRISGFPAASFTRVAKGRYLSIPRTELSESIYRAIEGKVETMFGNSVEHLEQTAKYVQVSFESGHRREFDLVVGADGLHSRIRELVFGPEAQYEKYLGYKVAAFQVKGYRPRNELVYFMYTEVSQQVSRFSMRDDRTMFLFTFRDDRPEIPAEIEEQKKLLQQRFGNSGWECPQILQSLHATDDLYFDRISQIRMDPREGLWTSGRITLLGDAASCVSLLAGQGTALAMVAAYILAGELHRAGGDYQKAFTKYQELFGPFVLKKQIAALRFAGAFAPKSQFSMFLRNQIMKLFSIGWIADLAFGRDLADHIVLPEY